LSAIEVNVHIVLLGELPASPDCELNARVTIIRDSQAGEIPSHNTAADPEQKN
jgi:hypothetical protein